MQYRRGSLNFDVLELGKPNACPIILLHGFPADVESWRPVAKHLVSAGHYVLVPQQRGDTPPARPRQRSQYRLSELTKDVAALLKAARAPKAHIVGHDWGGVVAWAFALTHPDKTVSLTAVSAPHPRALVQALGGSRQLFLSWYMLFFQLPWLPERIITAQQGKPLHDMLSTSGLPTDIATKYTSDMLDRNRLRGALNWYRAIPFTLPEIKKLGPCRVPTLFIYGRKDRFLSEKAAIATRQWVKGYYVYVDLPAATHWIPETSPEWLAEEITKFIR